MFASVPIWLRTTAFLKSDFTLRGNYCQLSTTVPTTVSIMQRLETPPCNEFAFYLLSETSDACTQNYSTNTMLSTLLGVGTVLQNPYRVIVDS